MTIYFYKFQITSKQFGCATFKFSALCAVNIPAIDALFIYLETFLEYPGVVLSILETGATRNKEAQVDAYQVRLEQGVSEEQPYQAI